MLSKTDQVLEGRNRNKKVGSDAILAVRGVHKRDFVFRYFRLIMTVSCYFNQARVHAFIDQQTESTRRTATCPCCALPAFAPTRVGSGAGQVVDG